jgi:predicted adenylyl cyclase CyaB
MARNVEIKAWVDDLDALAARAAAIADSGPTAIPQDDTFFACPTPGDRLKLRAFEDGSGQLIFYRRDDRAGPKESFYVLSPTASPDTLREALTLAHGQVGRVRKHRTLFLVGRTRVHLDRVDGLGTLMELEVVLGDGEGAEAGMQEARGLMDRLGIAADRLVVGAYVDLLRRGA